MITTVSDGLVAVVIMFIEQAIVAASISPHLEETERPRATPASVISKAVPRGGDVARGARGQTKPANAARMPLNPPSLD